MSYVWKQAIKNSKLSGTAVYYVKHGLFPELRVKLRMMKLNQIRRTGTYDFERITAFHGTHTGEACVVLGNGPSVNPNDLDLIAESGLCSFGANRISDIFSKTTWRPTYMCAMEHGFLNTIGGEEAIDKYLLNLYNEGIGTAFINEEFRKKVTSRAARSIAVFIRCPLAPLYTTAVMPFSEDPSLYISDLGSVTHFAIQIAIYMGFQRIYLYGIDNTYCKYLGTDGYFHVENRLSSHADGIKAVRDDMTASIVPKTRAQAYRTGGFADMRKSEIGYKICQEHTEKHGQRIFNTTHGGRLEVFERIGLKEALRREAAL